MKSIILSSLVLGALGFPADTHVVHEKRDAPRRHYVRGAPADGKLNLPVQLALKQSNMEEGAQRLYDMADPSSANYGKHMTAQEAIDFYAADTQTINTVTDWLIKAGIPSKDIVLDKTRTWINIESTVEKMEKVLQTRYHVYENKLTGRDHIGVEEYSLPKEISSFVDFVYPAVSLAKMQRRYDLPPEESIADKYSTREPLRALDQDAIDRLNSNKTVGCDEILSPQCIRDLYKIPQENNPEFVNSLGIWATDDTFDQEDLDIFFQKYGNNIPAGTKPQLALINGATAPVRQEDGGVESLLDMQMSYPIIAPQNIVLFQNKALRNDFSQFFADWASAVDKSFCKTDPNYDNRLMCGKYQPSNVLSVSYGDAEMDEPVPVVQRVCNEFMKLGTVGVTIVVASGDTGIASRQNQCAGPHHDIFTPSFLAVCPFVTAVGSTMLPKGSKIGDPEIVTTSFSPGGGFSNIFSRPSYQNKAVSNYLLRHNPNYFSYETANGTIPTDTRGIYNRAGRAYPDVSAAGDNGLVVAHGNSTLVGGTSMSAPIIASIFNRINDARLSAGKGPIGFANPALYAAASKVPGFYNDVTVGDQSLGGIFSDRGLSACGNNGFSAVEGWDPVTGFGTPNYPKWEKFFLELCDRAVPCGTCVASDLPCQYRHNLQRRGPKGGKGRRLALIRQGLAHETADHTMPYTQQTTHSAAVSPHHLQISNSTSPLPSPTLSPSNHEACTESALSDHVKIFMSHLFPVMPVVDEARLQADCGAVGSLSPSRFALLLAVAAVTRIQLRLDHCEEEHSDKGRGIEGISSDCSVTGLHFLAAAEEARQKIIIAESMSEDAILTSFFLFVCYGNLEKHKQAWFYLNQSISMAILLELDNERPESLADLTEEDIDRRRRIFWLLFISERTYALQRRLPVLLRRTVPKPQIFDSEYPIIMNDFVNHVNVFECLPPELYEWQPTSSSTAKLSQLGQKVIQALRAVQPQNSVLESQQFDTLITQHWLRVTMWRLICGIVSQDYNGSIAMPDLSLPFDAGSTIMSSLASVSNTSKNRHGISIEQKLFDIGLSIVDVTPSSRASAMSLGPQDLLGAIVGTLRCIRGRESHLLPKLLQHSETRLHLTKLGWGMDMQLTTPHCSTAVPGQWAELPATGAIDAPYTIGSEIEYEHTDLGNNEIDASVETVEAGDSLQIYVPSSGW
ncbi:hypothetical protein PWT90_06855 [Aphanocladium album]|nr:hypothetical protein PWT90_06855 [Aphanocladium album]